MTRPRDILVNGAPDQSQTSRSIRRPILAAGVLAVAIAGGAAVAPDAIRSLQQQHALAAEKQIQEKAAERQRYISAGREHFDSLGLLGKIPLIAPPVFTPFTKRENQIVERLRVEWTGNDGNIVITYLDPFSTQLYVSEDPETKPSLRLDFTDDQLQHHGYGVLVDQHNGWSYTSQNPNSYARISPALITLNQADFNALNAPATK